MRAPARRGENDAHADRSGTLVHIGGSSARHIPVKSRFYPARIVGRARLG
jgi:hypothetical protein